MVQYLNNNNNFNSGFAAFMAAKNQQAPQQSKFGKFLWWTFLFLVAWWIVGLFMEPKTTQQPAATPDATVTVDVSNVPVEKLAGDAITANVQGLRISNIDLKNFARSATDNTDVTLIDGDGFIEVGVTPAGTTAPVATTKWTKSGDNMVWKNADGIEFSRTVTVDNYIIRVTDTIKNNSKRDYSFAPYARLLRKADDSSSAGVYTGSIAYVNNDLEHNDWSKMDKKSFAYTTTNGFVGFADQYWETVANVDAPDQTVRVKKQGELYEAGTTAAPVNVAAGTTKQITTNIFAGPRDARVLKNANTTINGIVETMDYGWFWFLAQPMLWCINAIHSFVMNYGLAIIIFTILIRILMWPLTRKSYVSMLAMQKMQPELQKVQKLYANDRQRMQMEMMRVYQTHKTSPMSGCLPMLIQIPIFFALYKALLISVQMRNAHFLWISDLATMDPYFILPILMGATMWLQQYLQSNKTDKSNPNDIAAQTAKTMKWMPILFTIMFAWMPAGLVLYWTVSNIFGIGQMMWLKHKSK
ncbi:MAG: membrane protein insertase YidC [Alphaproteobacteria bacterium]|nr:membrane protein insertase YidC [Alphaproteobacteria bacterium]